MKAVVLEKRDGYAAVLKEDGTIEKIKRRCEVGDTIELNEKPKILKFSTSVCKYGSVAAALALIIFGVHTVGESQPCAYVSMDVNPSLEYVLNRNDEVIEVKALNEDAQKVIDALADEGVNGESIVEAIEDTAGLYYEMGYFGDEEDDILVAVSAKDDSNAGRIATDVESTLVADDDTIYVEMHTASIADHTTAESYGLSTGRYIKALEATMGSGYVDEELSVENAVEYAKTATVSELLNRTEETVSADEDTDESSDEDVAEDTDDSSDEEEAADVTQDKGSVKDASSNDTKTEEKKGQTTQQSSSAGSETDANASTSSVTDDSGEEASSTESGDSTEVIDGDKTTDEEPELILINGDDAGALITSPEEIVELYEEITQEEETEEDDQVSTD